MVDLSERVELALEAIFPEAERASVAERLRREIADELPRYAGVMDPARYDRLRMSALKLSDGTLEGLERAVALGKRDWRDLLRGAGLAEAEMHLRWYEVLLAQGREAADRRVVELHVRREWRVPEHLRRRR